MFASDHRCHLLWGVMRTHKHLLNKKLGERGLRAKVEECFGKAGSDGCPRGTGTRRCCLDGVSGSPGPSLEDQSLEGAGAGGGSGPGSVGAERSRFLHSSGGLQAVSGRGRFEKGGGSDRGLGQRKKAGGGEGATLSVGESGVWGGRLLRKGTRMGRSVGGRGRGHLCPGVSPTLVGVLWTWGRRRPPLAADAEGCASPALPAAHSCDLGSARHSQRL